MAALATALVCGFRFENVSKRAEGSKEDAEVNGIGAVVMARVGMEICSLGGTCR